MTSSEARPEGQKSTLATWRTRIIGALVFLALVVIAYFILSAFIPRWWAQRIAEMVNGSFSKGIGWGLVFGGLCTAIPLFLLLFAVLVWRKRAGRFAAGAAAILAVLAAIPNLMTLTIVLGNSNAAHAGERILDVDAPAFRGASLVAAVIVTIIFMLATVGIFWRRWRRKHPGKQTPAVSTRPPRHSANLSLHRGHIDDTPLGL